MPVAGQVKIHATAVVAPGAELDHGVVVDPYAVIGAQVRLGAGTRVGSHVVIQGDTEIGRRNRIEPHAVLGGPAQIRDAEGQGSLVIGDHNWMREHCTVHCGSPGSTTRVGQGNMLMVHSHVAHDCLLGDGIEMANGVQLAGHVEVGDHATFGGLAAVHQFARVGAHALVGAGAMVSRDVPPFSLASGDRARIFGINVVGLRRRGFSADERHELDRGLKALLSAPTLRQGLAQAHHGGSLSGHMLELIHFAETSTRGLCALANRGEKFKS